MRQNVQNSNQNPNFDYKFLNRMKQVILNFDREYKFHTHFIMALNKLIKY